MPAVVVDPRLACALDERASAAVPQQGVVGGGGDVEIRVPVQVEVRRHAPVPAQRHVGPRAAADVDEPALDVVEQGAAGQPTLLLPAGDVELRVRVDDEEVHPAVVVVVEPAQPAAHHRDGIGLGHRVAERSVAEVEPDLVGDGLQSGTDEAGCAHEGRCRPGRIGHRWTVARASLPHDHEAAALLSELQRPPGRPFERRDDPGRPLALARLEGETHPPYVARLARASQVGDDVPRDPQRRGPIDLTHDGLGWHKRHLGEAVDAALRAGGRLCRRAGWYPGRNQQPHEAHGSGERESADEAAVPAGEVEVRRPRDRNEPFEQRSCGAHERERPEQRDLRPELGGLRGDQDCGEHSDAHRVHPTACPARGHGLRVGDHEEQEDEHLGRERQHPPEILVRDRAEVPPCRHRVPGGREHGEADGEREPEADGDLEQAQPPENQEAAGDDEDQREREPRGHRPPPEVERLRELRAEHEKAQDEPEVGRIEHVAAVEADQVLREQSHRRRPGEDPPAAHAPPVPVLRPRDAQDEGDAVPGQKRARGPHQHLLTPKRDPDFEHGTGTERDEDLGDRETEVERHLPEHLQRDDHCREVEARIPDCRQQHRIRGAPDPQSRPAKVDDGGRAHQALNATQAESPTTRFDETDTGASGSLARAA